MAWTIFIGGKKFGSEYLGIRDTDLVMIDRRNMRLVKSSDDGETWQEVHTPENYGRPSISIIRNEWKRGKK